jgi:hypothetical protein
MACHGAVLDYPGRVSCGYRKIGKRLYNDRANTDHAFFPDIRANDRAVADPGILTDGDHREFRSLVSNRHIQVFKAVLSQAAYNVDAAPYNAVPANIGAAYIAPSAQIYAVTDSYPRV